MNKPVNNTAAKPLEVGDIIQGAYGASSAQYRVTHAVQRAGRWYYNLEVVRDGASDKVGQVFKNWRPMSAWLIVAQTDDPNGRL